MLPAYGFSRSVFRSGDKHLKVRLGNDTDRPEERVRRCLFYFHAPNAIIRIPSSRFTVHSVDMNLAAVRSLSSARGPRNFFPLERKRCRLCLKDLTFCRYGAFVYSGICGFSKEFVFTLDRVSTVLSGSFLDQKCF